MENYRIVIIISRRTISLYYCQEGGELKPFPGSEWPQPLALIYSDSGVTLGEEAAMAAAAGNPNAINDYFTYITEPGTVKIGASQVERRELLLLALENRFKELLNRTFFGTYGTLENNRSSAPLLLLTAPDLMDNDVTYLKGLMSNAGYGNMKVDRLDKVICDSLKNSKPVLLINSDGEDLYLTLSGGDYPFKKLAGKGKDPRVDELVNRIWDDISLYVIGTTREKELPILELVAKKFISSGKSEETASIKLSSGERPTYFITRDDLVGLSAEDTNFIHSQLDRFLADNGIQDKANVFMIRWGEAAGNDFFANLFDTGFPFKGQQDENSTKTVRRYISTIRIGSGSGPRIENRPEGYPPPPPSAPADSWKPEELKQLRQQVISCRSSVRSNNRQNAERIFAKMKLLAGERAWPTEAEWSSVHSGWGGVCIPAIAEIEKYFEGSTAPTSPPPPPTSLTGPSWSVPELRELYRLVVPTGASVRSGNREKVADGYAKMKAMANGRAWPSETEWKNVNASWPAKCIPAIKEMEDFLTPGRGPVKKPVKTIITDTKNPPSKVTPPPIPPKKKEGWSADELAQVRRIVIPAEASAKVGRHAKVSEALAKLRKLAAGRPWPEQRQNSDKPTWRERITALEKFLKTPPPLP